MALSFGAPIGLLIAVTFDWPIVFAAIGALSLLLAGANRRVWRNLPAADRVAASGSSLKTLAVAAQLAPTVLWATALYAMYTYLGEGLSALGFSSDEIARTILFYGCGAIAGTLIGGRMADRCGPRPTCAIGLAALGSCLLLLLVALHLRMFVDWVFGLASLSAQLFFPAQQLRLANGFPSCRAAILAWNNSALFLGISLGSLIGGQAISFSGFDLDLIMAAAIAMIGWVINRDGGRRGGEFGITPPQRRLGVQAS